MKQQGWFVCASCHVVVFRCYAGVDGIDYFGEMKQYVVIIAHEDVQFATRQKQLMTQLGTA
jgi:hypothetical protein